jgi:transposase
MRKNNTSLKPPKAAVCGIDLGSRHSEICVLDAEGAVIERGRAATTPAALERAFGQREPLPIAIETGGQSNWVRRLLSDLGHEVIVADAKRVKLITDTHSKDDRRDARWLAQILLRWPELLKPVAPRSLESEQHRALLKARESLVEARVKLILCARGILAGFGRRLPAATSEAFARKTALLVPEPLREALQPALDAVAALGLQIRLYGRRVEQLCRTRYRPATKRMRSIQGVGPQTALAFTLELDDDAARLRSSRAAGALAGLRPKRRESGQQQPELSITKTGNRMLRKLLVQCAHYILSRGPDSCLKRWGLGLAARSGTKRGKRRAVIAVARKLAVLLHALWRRDEDFDPLRGATAPATAC